MCGCSDLSAQARRREDCEKQHAPLRRALLGGHQAEPPIVPLSSLYPQALFPLLVCAENSKRGGPTARRAPRNELPFVVVLRRVLRLRY